MAERLEFGVLATDEASQPLHRIGEAAEDVGESMSGSASTGARVFERELTRLEGTLDSGQTQASQFNKTVGQETSASFDRGQNAASEFGSEISGAVTQSVQRLESSVLALADAQAKQEKQSDESGKKTSAWHSIVTGINQGLELYEKTLGRVISTGVEFFSSTVENAQQIGRFATVLGITTAEMSKFAYAASTVGVELDDVRDAMGTAAENIAEFATLGTGTAEEALRRFNLQLTDGSGRLRSMANLMPELADRLGGVSDRQERLRLAIQLFGEEAAYRLLPVLENGSAGLAKLGAEGEKLGVVLSDTLIRDSQEWQANTAAFSASIQGVANSLTAAVLPSLNAVIPKVVQFITSFRESEFFKSTLVPALQDSIKWVETLVEDFDKFAPTLETLKNATVDSFEFLKASLEETVTLWSDMRREGKAFVSWLEQAEVFQPLSTGARSANEEVGFLRRTFELVNASVGIAVGGVSDALATVGEKVQGAAEGFSRLEAKIPGLRGLAEADARLSEKLQGNIEWLGRVEDAALETAADWIDGNMRAQKSQDTVTKATSETNKEIEKTSKVIDKTTADVVKALDTQKKAFDKQAEASAKLNRAAEVLGIRAREVLEAELKRYVTAFESAVGATEKLTKANVANLRRYYEPLREKWEEITGHIAPTFERALIEAQRKAKAQAPAIGETIKVGVATPVSEVPAAVEAQVTRTAEAFKKIPVAAKKSGVEAREGLLTELEDAAVQGAQAGAETGTQYGGAFYQNAKGFFTNLTAEGTRILGNKSLWETAGKAAGDGLRTGFEPETFATKIQNVSDQALKAFEDKFGEIQRGAGESVRFIENSFGELVPVVVNKFGQVVKNWAQVNLELREHAGKTGSVIGNEIGEGSREAAEAMQRMWEVGGRYLDYLEAGVKDLGRGFGNMAHEIQIVGGSFGEIIGEGTTFGSTIEELQAQISDYQSELHNLSILMDQAGVSTGLYSARKEFLLGVLGELGGRLRELQDEQEGYNDTLTDTTGYLNEGIDAFGDYTTEIGHSITITGALDAGVQSVGRSISGLGPIMVDATGQIVTQSDLWSQRLERIANDYQSLGLKSRDTIQDSIAEQVDAFSRLLDAGELTSTEIGNVWENLSDSIAQNFLGVETIGEATAATLREEWGDSFAEIYALANQLRPAFSQIFEIIERGVSGGSHQLDDLSTALEKIQIAINGVAGVNFRAVEAANAHAGAIDQLAGSLGRLSQAAASASTQGTGGRQGGGSAGAALSDLPDVNVDVNQTVNNVSVRVDVDHQQLLNLLRDFDRYGDR